MTSVAPTVILYSKISESLKRNNKTNNKKNIVVIGSGFSSKSFCSNISKEKYNLIVISPNTKSKNGNVRFVNQPNYINYLLGDSYESVIKLKNVTTIKDNLKNVDIKNKIIKLESNKTQKYDILVIAVGSVTNNFGIFGVDDCCLHLRTETDIKKLSSEINKLDKTSNIAILGGGILGVEIASVLKTKFKNVSVYEMANNLLPMKELENCRKTVTDHLISQDIKINCNSKVKKIYSNGNQTFMEFENNQLTRTKIYDKIIYTCGIKPNPIMNDIFNFKSVNKKLIIVDNENNELNDIYAIGDCNGIQPMSAQNAKKQGEYLANLLNNKIIDDYAFDSLGTIIRLHNGTIINNKNYVGYMPLFVHNIVNFINSF